MGQAKGIDIIGAGFSGLMQAFYFAEAGYSVRVFENDIRIGGLLGSVRRDGFLIEQAANAFLSNQELERVSNIIGVPLHTKKDSARKRFIYKDGQMRRWPLSFGDSLGVLKFLLSWRFAGGSRPEESESLREWGIRCLGQNVTDNLLEPAMQGVYASRAEALNAHLIVSSLTKKSKKGRLRGSVAPQKGMQQWLDGILHYLKKQKVEIVFDDYFSSAQDRPKVLAVGLQSLNKLVKEKKISAPKSLLATRSVSLTSVFLGYNQVPDETKEGFGCLFPQNANFNALGVLFNHNIFADRTSEGSSETWIYNDDKQNFSEMSQEVLIKEVLADRLKFINHSEDPAQVSVHQWPSRIPLYDHKLLQFHKDLAKQKQDYLLVGNYLGDLGLSKILDKARLNVAQVEGGYFV